MGSFFDEIARNRVEQEHSVNREKELEELRTTISTRLAEKTKDIDLFGNKDQATVNTVKGWIGDIIKSTNNTLPIHEQTKLIEEMFFEITSLGKIHHLMEDPTISEIMVNAPNEVWIERKGKLIRTDVVFKNDKEVLQLARRIVGHIGRRIDNSNPIVDARLPDGSRVAIIIPPISMKGVVITIRKFFQEKLTVDDLIKFGTISPEGAKFLEKAVAARANIIISGGTGSGKTTTLNVVSNFVPDGERIFTLEDSAELQLSNEHFVPLESREENAEGKGAISIRDLVKTSLRHRPDRLIVGEVRDGSCFDLLQACNTGHDGSMGTVHSNNPEMCVTRLENLILQAGFDLPAKFIRQTITDAVDIVVQIQRLKDGSRKITHITEVIRYDSKNEKVLLGNIYEYKLTGVVDGKLEGTFEYTGYKPTENLIDKFEKSNIDFYKLVEGSEE